MEIKCAFKEMVPIVKLVEHPRNPNRHPDKQVKMLAKIIEYHGWRHPIIVSKRSGFVVAGHGRLMAAKELSLEKVPVDYQDFESEAAEFQFLVADNKIAELAEHDDLKMIAEIKDLGLVDIDFDLLGLDNFNFVLDETFESQEQNTLTPIEENRKWKIEVQFPTETEMRNVYDELISRGYLVKEIK
jgi:hypothetical protein